jgi:hypothetical protein
MRFDVIFRKSWTILDWVETHVPLQAEKRARRGLL